MPHANLVPTAALIVLATCLGCTSPEESLAISRVQAAAGDLAGEEQALRDGLEDHPEDVGLLIAMSELYLRSEPETRYKPRLALHYAMRADRAARRKSPDAAALLHRAYRAAGGFEQADELLARGLARIDHPDADNPESVEPVDSDLLEPTLSNLLEQNRRTAGQHLPHCPSGLTLIPGGLYPLAAADGAKASEQRVSAFCAESRPQTEPPRRVSHAVEITGLCAQRQRRGCSAPERRVLCGPMRNVLGPHPACDDERYVRCCDEPAQSRAPITTEPSSFR